MRNKKILLVVLLVTLMLSAFCIQSFAAGSVRGDMDNNGEVNIDDAIYMLNHSLFQSLYPISQSGDLDGDGIEDIDDAMYMINHVMFPASYPLAPEHSLVHHDAISATCTVNGNIEYWSCEDCGKFFTDEDAEIEVANVTVAALGHDWIDATCTEPKTCSVCGETEGAALGHDWIDATCTEPKTCSVCGETEGAALGHDWIDATCTEPKTCSVCGETEGAALGHDWVDATCTEPKTCSVCGETEGAALGHDWIDATCTEPKTCSVCGETEGAALGHSYGTPVPNGDETHTATCANPGCSDFVTAACGGGTATCENKAVCSECGAEYGELADHAGEIIWMKHTDNHYQVYSCCCLQMSSPEAHTIENGACTECGFNPAVSATSVAVTPGQTDVNISVSVADNPGITGMMATIYYSSDVFTVTDAISGDAFSPLAFTKPATFTNGCTLLWDGIEINDRDIKNGEFLTIVFDVSPTAPVGEYSILIQIKAYDNDLNPLTFVISGGKVTVTNS